MVKGSVCKTDIHRFKSGRRLTSLLILAFASGCTGASEQLTELQKNLARRDYDPPTDVPDWSEAQFVRWSSLRSPGNRILIVDVPGGEIDQYLNDEKLTLLLNEQWVSIFLHPRARPSLTGHLGWPSVTFLDDKGCLWAHGAPTSADELLELAETAAQKRDADEKSGLPAYHYDRPEPPTGGGTWTLDEPKAAAVFVQPDRGAPAVIFDGKPYVYGNRADAELFVKRPAGRAFLEDLPQNHSYKADEGPIFQCPLPVPPPVGAPPTEDEEGEETDGDGAKGAKPPAGG